MFKSVKLRLFTFLSLLWIVDTVLGIVYTDFLQQKMRKSFVNMVHKLSRVRVESLSCTCSLLVVLSPHWHLGTLELPLVPADRRFLPFQGAPLLQVGPVQEITQ